MPDSKNADQDIRPVALNVSGKTLALITGGGLVLGALIVVGAIMPAEFNTDPLGIGKATGISRLWAPEAQTFGGADSALAWSSETPRQSHIVEIALGAADWPEAAVEYKVTLKPGQTIFYKWTATKIDGTPMTAPIEVDQHGHDVPPEGQAETVVQYQQKRLMQDQGSLTAPIDGIYGWYFRNHDPDPILIRLEIEGYYTLVPPGEPGNEGRISPWQPEPDEPIDDLQPER